MMKTLKDHEKEAVRKSREQFFIPRKDRLGVKDHHLGFKEPIWDGLSEEDYRKEWEQERDENQGSSL